MAHRDTVQQMYDAFGRGDVPAILQCLSDAVEWEYGAPPVEVPWLEARRGRDAVAGFFGALQGLEFHKFAPKAVLQDGHLVLGVVDVECTVKATGARIVEDDEVHVFWFGTDGKVARFRHRTDTYVHWRALQSTMAHS